MLRVLVIAVVGMFLGGFAVVVYAGLQTAPPPAPVAQAKVTVIAAAHPVRAGSLLQPGDLGVHELPADQVPAGAHRDTTEGRNALVGAMVRRTLDEKEVIAADDVLRPGDRGFLAAVLQPGTRAVSVEVDAVSGEAGLIWPGDRVDLILTQTIEGTDQSLGHRVAGEMVLADVRVIAVDQQLIQGGQANGLLEGRTPSSRTITLEVTPQDASRIAVATRLGKLQVVLRAAQPDAHEFGGRRDRRPGTGRVRITSVARLAGADHTHPAGADLGRLAGPSCLSECSATFNGLCRPRVGRRRIAGPRPGQPCSR